MNSYLLKEYQMKQKMVDYALKHGHFPYDPPLFEDYDNFSTLSCEVKKEQLVTVINGTRFQLLRPDITTMIMNHVRPQIKGSETLKLFYQSTVYRLLESGIKSINQFGIEYLGVAGVDYDMAVIDLATKYLEGVRFAFEVGTTKFLTLLLQLCNLDTQQEKIFRKLVDIKNQEELVKFAEVNHLPSQVQAILPELFRLRGSYEEVVANLMRFDVGEVLRGAVDDVSYLQDFTQQQLIFDLSMTSELTYYDGVIFKGYYRNSPCEVLSGGRYAGNAIGFVVDVDNWISAQKEADSHWNI